MAVTVFLADETATLKLGEDFSSCISNNPNLPLVVYLNGDLGAGKTTFARGLLRALGHTGAVKSPTYAIVESYRLPEISVHHFDLYRFTSPEEWLDAGLDDVALGESHYLYLIEWSAQGGDYVPAADLVFNFAVENTGRVCAITAHTAQGQRSLALWQM